ncbi:MAG: NAD+ synthase [Deltaproteobacteria bacterium]|nr:MAG: NAD+ synthase [Deltaproteobacteria bacterium]
MRIALAQIDTTVGAFAANGERVLAQARSAAEQGAQLVVFPELTLCGYPPKDLLELREFVDRCQAALVQLAKDPVFGRVRALVGFPQRHDGPGAGLYNAAALLHEGRIAAVARKSLLPTYDVFDEGRYFDPGPEVTLVDIGGVRVGVTICEDLWNDKQFWRQPRYLRDPLEELTARGAEIVVNLSASPYALGKARVRREMLAAASRRHGVPIAMCNLVGGNDSLIFDGRSLVVSGGEVRRELPRFREELLVEEIAPRQRTAVAGAARTAGASLITPETTEAPPGALAVVAAFESKLDDGTCAELAEALTLGIRDYTVKTGFKSAVLGLSGGIDSALTAVLAAGALGPENVTTIAMPSRYTASMSNEDAETLAGRLAVHFHKVAIEPIFRAYLDALAPLFAGRPADVTEENLQARIRGMLLMAFSNKTGALLLSTGNKSELATGFCTLYGDMAGGLAAIGDLSKTAVYALARWFNKEREIIPKRIIERPPTAELRENQTDQDTLPPYEELDRVLAGHVEEHLGAGSLIERGLSEDLVRRVLKLVVASEYKRRQAAPSLRVTARAFGEGWRFPIAHGYRH